MLDTNLLLAIAFSAVTNFAHQVPIPHRYVPEAPSNVQIVQFGSLRSPTDMRATVGNGASYLIFDGSVVFFGCEQRFFQKEDPDQIAKYLAKPVLTPEQALALGSNLVQRLVKTGGPLTNGLPRLRQARDYEGQRIPCFIVEWPDPGSTRHSFRAEVDIDGRTGEVVQVRLLDAAFRDREEGRRIEKQAYTPDPAPELPPRPPPPRPTKEDGEKAIP
jgi:hypothetical protein